MFSVVFPGQGSQAVGMCSELYQKYQIVKDYFNEANDTLNFDISKLILEGPKSELDLTINTQPAIFLVSYSIFNVIKKEFNIDLNKAKFFAGHSLGEYSALACAGYLDFSQTLKILKLRGEAMQNAVPKGKGAMLVILGSTYENVEDILIKNEDKFKAQIANDNSEGQIVVSGKINDIEKLSIFLKKKSIKNILLPVSAPFHCWLMKKATNEMSKHLNDLNFLSGKNSIISNVTAEQILENNQIRDLLIRQIENKVRWRESILNMINAGVNQFIEIGPGKVLSGLIKRIDRNVKSTSINSLDDIKDINI